MLKFIANLSLNALDKVVLDYIKEHPGSRLFEIDSKTLKSHHNWGSKYVVQRLEDDGKIMVVRTRHGRKIAPKYYAYV